jgi:hypothetical protein
MLHGVSPLVCGPDQLAKKGIDHRPEVTFIPHVHHWQKTAVVSAPAVVGASADLFRVPGCSKAIVSVPPPTNVFLSSNRLRSQGSVANMNAALNHMDRKPFQKRSTSLSASPRVREDNNFAHVVVAAQSAIALDNKTTF